MEDRVLRIIDKFFDKGIFDYRYLCPKCTNPRIILYQTNVIKNKFREFIYHMRPFYGIYNMLDEVDTRELRGIKECIKTDEDLKFIAFCLSIFECYMIALKENIKDDEMDICKFRSVGLNYLEIFQNKYAEFKYILN